MTEAENNLKCVAGGVDKRGTGPEPANANDEVSTVTFNSNEPKLEYWDDPEYLEIFLVSDDKRERDLVSRLIEVQYRMDGYLDRAKGSEYVSEASAAFTHARGLSRESTNIVKALIAYRNDGISIVHQVPGLRRVGLGAKLQKLRTPAKESREALLIERLQASAYDYRDIGRHFARMAGGTRYEAENDCAIRRARINGLPIPTYKNADLWDGLSVKAFRTMNAISEVSMILERGGRKVEITA